MAIGPDTPLIDAARERAKTLAEKNAAPRAVLTFADRCDQCGAQAYVQAFMSNASSLLFCRHHFFHHRAKLELVAESVIDETGLADDRQKRVVR